MDRFLNSIISVTLLCIVVTPSVVSVDGTPPSQLTVNCRVTEKAPVGTVIGNIVSEAQLAKYYSSSEISQLRFSLFQDPSYSVTLTYVTIDEISSALTVKRRIDRDLICPGLEHCFLPVGVGISPSNFFLFIAVQIEVIDINDQTPSFPVPVTSLAIPESVLPGSSFAISPASDSDSPPNGVQRYILSGTTDRKFELSNSSTSGSPTLVVVDFLDRERASSYHLVVTAVDGGAPSRSTSMLINITIEDVNDNPPQFTQGTYRVHLRENSTGGSWVLQVVATDLDVGDNARIKYAISTINPVSGKTMFQIDQMTGNITLARADLDRETVSSYVVIATATDMGVPSLSASATVVIAIDDVNDNTPQITVSTMTSDGTVKVTEGADPGTFVALVSATDADWGENGNVSCDLDLNLDPSPIDVFQLVRVQTGRYKLVTRTVLDYENQTGYDVTIVCLDNGNDPQLTNRSVIHVHVTDVNDNSPVCGSSRYNVTLAENNLVGTVVTRVTATDRDSGENGRVTFNLIGPGARMFFVDPETGIIVANVSFDYESTTSVQVQVEAVDHGTPPRSSYALVYVTIRDVNDVAPSFQVTFYSFQVMENLPPNQTVGFVSATDPEIGANGVVTYDLDTPNDSFKVNSTTGEIQTIRSLDREENSVYKFKVIAGNEGYPLLTSSAEVTVKVDDVNDNAPVIQFPRVGNDSVFISNALVQGQTVTQIKALDDDEGLNSKLFYSFQTTTNLFKLDGGSGIIFVGDQLSSILEQSFHFVVQVNDLGQPPLSSAANLTIVVNASIAAPTSARTNTGPLATNPNLIVVICVASVSGLVAILLLTAIFCIVCRARNLYRRKLMRCRINLNPGGRREVPSVSRAVDNGGGGGAAVVNQAVVRSLPDGKDGELYFTTDRQQRHSQRLEMTSASGPDIGRTWTRDRDRESWSEDSGRGPSESSDHQSAPSDHDKGSVERQKGTISDGSRLSYVSASPETFSSHSPTKYPTNRETSLSRRAQRAEFRDRNRWKLTSGCGNRPLSSHSETISNDLGTTFPNATRQTLDSRYGSSEMSDATSVTSGTYVINHGFSNYDVSRWNNQLDADSEVIV